MERLIFGPEPFRFEPVEHDIDVDHWYPDRGGAVVRGRTLQQTYTKITITTPSTGKYQVDYRDKVPTPSKFPYKDTQAFTAAADVVNRAQVLRAYGFTVTTVQRPSDNKWYCRIDAVATGGPALPTAKGPDTGFVFDAEKSAKKRAVRLALVGFGVTVGKRTDGKWQITITNLPTYVTGTKSSTSSTASSSGTSSTSGSSTGSKTTTTTTAPAPPHKLEVVNSAEPAHKLSDAVVQSFRDFAADVFALTGEHLDANFGDTIRSISTKGSATKSSDTFTWHKTGRAADIDQGLKWVITKEPLTSSGEQYFRLYLKHKNQSTTTGVKKFPAGTTFHSAYWSTVSPSWVFVDITAVAAGRNWLRIPAQSGYGTSGTAYNKQEWWHFQRADGLTWFQALREIYTDAQITTGVKAFASPNKHSARLRREGFNDTALKAAFPLVKKGNLEIRCPVGKDAANIADDVKAVQQALIRGGKLPAGSDTGTLNAATQTAIDTVQATLGSVDHVVGVGLNTHKEIGKL